MMLLLTLSIWVQKFSQILRESKFKCCILEAVNMHENEFCFLLPEMLKTTTTLEDTSKYLDNVIVKASNSEQKADHGQLSVDIFAPGQSLSLDKTIDIKFAQAPQWRPHGKVRHYLVRTPRIGLLGLETLLNSSFKSQEYFIRTIPWAR